MNTEIAALAYLHAVEGLPQIGRQHFYQNHFIVPADVLGHMKECGFLPSEMSRRLAVKITHQISGSKVATIVWDPEKNPLPPPPVQSKPVPVPLPPPSQPGGIATAATVARRLGDLTPSSLLVGEAATQAQLSIRHGGGAQPTDPWWRLRRPDTVEIRNEFRDDPRPDGSLNRFYLGSYGLVDGRRVTVELAQQIMRYWSDRNAPVPNASAEGMPDTPPVVSLGGIQITANPNVPDGVVVVVPQHGTSMQLDPGFTAFLPESRH